MTYTSNSQDFCVQCPWTHYWLTPPLESPWQSQVSLAQSLVGFLILSPGPWGTQGFACALQEPISLVLWKFCNQISVASKIKFPGGSQTLYQIPRLGNLLVKLLWYNCSPVCELFTSSLCGGANGDLPQEDLCTMLCLLDLPQPELLSPWQETADPCLQRRYSNTHRQIWLRLVCGGGVGHCSFPCILMCTRVLFAPFKCLWCVWCLILNVILPLLLSYWGLFFALGCMISVFSGIQHPPVIGCFVSSCDFGVIARENEHISFYSTILGAT